MLKFSVGNKSIHISTADKINGYKPIYILLVLLKKQVIPNKTYSEVAEFL